jgi:hypothetical protein
MRNQDLERFLPNSTQFYPQENRQIYDQKMSTSQEIHRLDGALELLRLPGLWSYE